MLDVEKEKYKNIERIAIALERIARHFDGMPSEAERKEFETFLENK